MTHLNRTGRRMLIAMAIVLVVVLLKWLVGY